MKRNRQSLLDLAKKASQSHARATQHGSAQQGRSAQNRVHPNQGFHGARSPRDAQGSLLGQQRNPQQAQHQAHANNSSPHVSQRRTQNHKSANTQSPAQMMAQHQPQGQTQDQFQGQTQRRPQQGRLDPDQPLLDLFTIFAKVWSLKWMVIAFGVLGCLLGVVIALMTPHTYYAESSLIVDPRDIQVTETKGINSQASSQILLAVVDSQIQLVRSTRVVEQTVKRLGLAQDSEFNGEDSNGVFSSIKDMFSSEIKSNDPTVNAIAYLRKHMGVKRDTDTFLVNIGMKTKNADKSVLVANTLVEEYLKEYSAQQSGLYSKASTSIDSRLEELRSRLDRAENDVVEYRATNDIIDVGGGVINTKEMLALSDELAKVRAEQINKSVLANELQGVDLSGVISGSFPQAALTTTLGDLRKQYSTAKSASDALAAGLGPRHPKFISAQTSVKTLEGEIQNELRRIISSTQRDVQRTAGAERQLVSKLDVLKARASDQSSENVGLRELERKATAIRGIYESLLMRARETTERGNLETASIQLISTAEKPKVPSSRSRKITVLIFGFLGGFLGFAIAAGLGAVQSLKDSFGDRNTSGPSDLYAEQNVPNSNEPHNHRSANSWTRNDGLERYYEQQLGEPTDFPEPPPEPPFDPSPTTPALAPHHPAQYAPVAANAAYQQQPHPAHQPMHQQAPQPMPQPMPQHVQQAAPQFGHYPYAQPTAPLYPQPHMMPMGHGDQGHHWQPHQQAPVVQPVQPGQPNQPTQATTQIYVQAQPTHQVAPDYVPHPPQQYPSPQPTPIQQVPFQQMPPQQDNTQPHVVPNAPVAEQSQNAANTDAHQANVTQLNTGQVDTGHLDTGDAADYQRLRGDIQRLRQRLETWSTDRA